MVRDVLVPKLHGVHVATVAACPVLALENDIRAFRGTCREDWLVACLEGGRGAIDLDKVDGLHFHDRLLAQHIRRVRREHAFDGLEGIAHPMTVDVHVVVISQGVAVLEPQLNGVHVEFALFELGDLLHARRVLAGIGIPEGYGRELAGVATVHFLPAFVGDFVLVGIGGRDRRGRAWSLARCIVGLHVIDVQVLKSFLFRRDERDFAVDVVAEIIVVPGFVDHHGTARLVGVEDVIGVADDDVVALIIGPSVRERRGDLLDCAQIQGIARARIDLAARETQRHPEVILNRSDVQRHGGIGCNGSLDKSTGRVIGLEIPGIRLKLANHGVRGIGEVERLGLALVQRDGGRQLAVVIMVDHGRVDLHAAFAADNVGHAAGLDGVAFRSCGVVGIAVLPGCCSVCRRGGVIGGVVRRCRQCGLSRLRSNLLVC